MKTGQGHSSTIQRFDCDINVFVMSTEERGQNKQTTRDRQTDRATERARETGRQRQRKTNRDREERIKGSLSATERAQGSTNKPTLPYFQLRMEEKKISTDGLFNTPPDCLIHGITPSEETGNRQLALAPRLKLRRVVRETERVVWKGGGKKQLGYTLVVWRSCRGSVLVLFSL